MNNILMPRSCNKQNSVNKRKVCGIKVIKIINYANIRGIKETKFLETGVYCNICHIHRKYFVVYF